MRAYTLVLSLVAHLLALALMVVVPVVATDVLPEPARILEFVHVLPVVPPPPAPVQPPRQRRSISSTIAPVEAPAPIAVEPEPAGPAPFDRPTQAVEGWLLDQGASTPEPLPSPPDQSEREPVRVGGMITRPERLHYVPPTYPPLARGAGVEGTVILEAVIAADGSIRVVRVLRSVPLLDSAAIEAVRQWVFTPTRLNGDAIPVVMTVTVTFRLR